MPADTPYAIDELEDEATRLRPAVRLTHLLLRACLDGGFAEFRLRAATGGAEVKKAGAWTPIMKFPPAVYGVLVDQFKIVAGAEHDLVVGDATPLRLRWHGRDVAGTMTPVGTQARVEEIQFRFALSPSPES
jgi:hypothetical protein